MARIRTLKPEFFHSKRLAKCSPHARLLAVALLQLADCEGRLKHIPMQIHSHAFPWEAKVNTQMLLGELQQADYLILYEIDGDEYIQIINFLKHQRLQGKEAQLESKLPPYNPESVENKGGNERGSDGEFPSASRGMTGTGEQGNRGIGTGEKEQGDNVELPPDPVLDVFKYWQEKLNHPKALLDPKRKKSIQWGLKNYSTEDCKKAIFGMSVTPHNIGQNDAKQRYDGLHIVFKDAQNVERFLANADNPKIKSLDKHSGFADRDYSHDQSNLGEISWAK